MLAKSNTFTPVILSKCALRQLFNGWVAGCIFWLQKIQAIFIGVAKLKKNGNVRINIALLNSFCDSIKWLKIGFFILSQSRVGLCHGENKKIEIKLTMNEMLGKIVKLIVTVPSEMWGTLVDLLEKLTGLNAEIWKGEIKKFLRKEKCWTDFQAYVKGGLSILEIPETNVRDIYTLKAYFGSNFAEFGLQYKYGDLESEPRPESRVEFVSSFAGSFTELFPVGHKRMSLEEYCFTPDQVTDIFALYYKLLDKADQTKYLFLIRQGDEYAVLCAWFNEQEPVCILHSFNNKDIINVGHMMVAIPVPIRH
jgi:hypothetical protein